MCDDDLRNADEPAAEDTADRSVGTLELFFDLVFVYAMSQVTVLMLADISWAGSAAGFWRSLLCGGRGPATPG